MDVAIGGIRRGVRAANAAGRPVCVHASLRSFGHVHGGAPTVVDALAPLGVRHLDPPLHAEKIWRVLQRHKEREPR